MNPDNSQAPKREYVGSEVVDRLAEITNSRINSTEKVLNVVRGDTPPCQGEQLEEMIELGEERLANLTTIRDEVLPATRAVYDPNAGYDDIPHVFNPGIALSTLNKLFDADADEFFSLGDKVTADAQQRLMKYWPDQVSEFNGLLNELVKPYLGRKDYSNLREESEIKNIGIVLPYFDKTKANWSLVYEWGFGSSTSNISIAYLIEENKWRLDDGTIIDNPRIALDYVQEMLTKITRERAEHMKMVAKSQRYADVPLEKALLAINNYDRRPVSIRTTELIDNPNGPTAEEKKTYAQICREVYAQEPAENVALSLVKKHEKDLASGDLEAFTNDLLRLTNPCYEYSGIEMIGIVDHIMKSDIDNNFGPRIIDVIARRKMMSSIDEPEVRSFIWQALDRQDDGKNGLTVGINQIVELYGVPATIQYLNKMLEFADANINPEKRLVKDASEEVSSKERRNVLTNVPHYHNRFTALQMGLDMMIEKFSKAEE